MIRMCVLVSANRGGCFMYVCELCAIVAVILVTRLSAMLNINVSTNNSNDKLGIRTYVGQG